MEQKDIRLLFRADICEEKVLGGRGGGGRAAQVVSSEIIALCVFLLFAGDQNNFPPLYPSSHLLIPLYFRLHRIHPSSPQLPRPSPMYPL